jgi:hypothetical protein
VKKLRQTSEGFMDKMLEDNTPAPEGEDLSEKIANIIDKKVAESMAKFTKELEKISPPKEEVETPVGNPKETEDETEDELEEGEEK